MFLICDTSKVPFTFSVSAWSIIVISQSQIQSYCENNGCKNAARGNNVVRDNKRIWL